MAVTNLYTITISPILSYVFILVHLHISNRHHEIWKEYTIDGFFLGNVPFCCSAMDALKFQLYRLKRKVREKKAISVE